MEIRAQVAYHFKIDPAKLVTGSVHLPEQITRTVSVGDELFTEKVSRDTLSYWDRDAIVKDLEKLCSEATRTARPAGSALAPVSDPAAGPAAAGEETDEISAF